MSASNCEGLFLIMTGVIGGLSIAHYAGAERLDDIHFWLTPVWLLLGFVTWRSERNRQALPTSNETTSNNG